MKWFPHYNYILSSKSPRRQELLRLMGLEFRILIKEVDETYPSNLSKERIPVYLAELKASPLIDQLNEHDMLITADTIVWLGGEVLEKPGGKKEAEKMLQKLSGNEHKVISGVCLSSFRKQKSFYAVSKVRFKQLSHQEIEYYTSTYKPYDKAGAYAIQEWIGIIGIIRIEGSFYNVMGLPVQKLYEEIIRF